MERQVPVTMGARKGGEPSDRFYVKCAFPNLEAIHIAREPRCKGIPRKSPISF